MKKLTILFIVLFMTGSFSLKGQTQMPNADFEGWSAAYPDNRPLNYNTIDTLGLHSCYKTTDKHGGTYAAKLRSLDTTIIIYNVKLPGVATLGKINISSMTITKGIPFTDKPNNFRGYYKYLPVNIDTMSVYLYFWRYNTVLQKQDTMGGVAFDTSATIGSYTLFDLPIQWDTNYTESPDSMNIILLASHTIQNHTSAFFDDFSFYYLATGFEQRLDDVLAEVYPNPATGLLTINNEVTTEISLYSIAGALIMRREAAEKNCQLDVSSLPRGVYVLRLKDDSGVKISKIILE
ncbi:MAG TPA: T9SS type A sorting domain-containing protein [Bacteroidales bacterium]|nr:T9SS type A sorting domain-containing protein [Bacteroidales bacterium]